MPASSDRNLLFGILALQMDFITREQLVAGMQAWVLAKDIALAEHLVQAGAMRPANRQLLEPLVEAHIRQHGDHPQQSLASISSLDALRNELAGLGDQQIDASMANIPVRNKSVQVADPYATISVGAASSQGMRFRILRPHAEGGLGRVSVALDGELGREVALKEIKPERADDPDSRGRFTREAEITGGLEHPGIVPVYGLGAYPDGRPFYAMRFIRGKSLKEAIEKFHAGRGAGGSGLGAGEKASGGRKPPGNSASSKYSPTEENLELRKLLQRLIDVCEAMDYAHSRGVLHRDLKPGNIMLGKYGETLVVDWGLAKPLGTSNGPSSEEKATDTTIDFSSLPEAALHPSSSGGTDPTMLGAALGTPAFMSPEQAQGRLDLLSPASDVFSLGAILYQILTGQPPYVAPTKEEVLRKAHVADYPLPRTLRRGIPPLLEAICLKALALLPANRYSSCRVLAQDLERFLADEPVNARRDSYFERLARLTRRHRAAFLASTAALAILAAVLFVGLLAVNHFRGAASTERDRARLAEAGAKDSSDTAIKARDEEKRQRMIAEERKVELQRAANKILERKRAGDRLIYAATTNQALRAWDGFQPQLTQQLLESLRPERTDGGLDYRGWEWDYLKRQCHSEKLRLEGHTASVNCVVYSPHGNLIASGSNDGTGRLWDAATGQAGHVLKGHLHAVQCVAFSADGKLLATGSVDATTRLWEVATGKDLATLYGHVLTVNSVAFDPQGLLLATAASDGTIQLYDLATKKQIGILPGHGGDVSCVTFSPDGTQLASAGMDQTVRLWDVAARKELKKFDGNTHYVFFTPDGKRLVFGGRNDLRIVELASGEVRGSIANRSRGEIPTVLAERSDTLFDGRTVTRYVRPPRGFVEAALSADGNRICTADSGMIQIWDVATAQEIRPLRGQTNVVAWSPDGLHIVNPGGDGAIRVWSVTENTEGMTLSGHKNRVASLAFSPDGQRLASSSLDHSIKIWDASTGKELVNLGMHAYDFQPATSDQPPLLRNVVSLKGHTSQVNRVAFSPDGRRLASAGQDNSLRVWDTATGTETLLLPFTGGVTSVTWSPDGKRLAAGSWDDDVHLFDYPSGQLVRKFEGHEENVAAIAFTKDGRLLASAGWDKTVRIWEIDTGRQLHVLLGDFLNHLTSVAFSHDDQLLAAAGEDMVISLWETTAWKEVRKLWGHTARIDDLTFSPDDRRLVSVGGSGKNSLSITGSVNVWDVSTGQKLLDLPGVFAATFDPAGRRLAVGLRSNDIRIYESAPVDDQPYRTGPFVPPPANKALASDDGKLRVLGFFTARRLPGIYGAPAVLSPSQDGREFLIAVVSLPNRFFIPSEEEYARLLEEEKKQGDSPSPRRECNTVYKPGRFGLLLPKADTASGEFVGLWPPRGFNSRIQMMQSGRVRPHERVALVIAWSVDHKAIEWPIQIQIDQDAPVPLPQVRLATDPRLVPPSVGQVELAKRVESAWKQVKTEKYAAAVAEAALVARDKEADGGTIYNAACVHALAVAKARQDSTLAETEREQHAERYAGQAVELLRQAVASGFIDAAQIKNDEDMDSLRQREDFQKLLSELEQKEEKRGK